MLDRVKLCLFLSLFIATPTLKASVPIDKVVLIIFENASYSQVMRDPYFKTLSSQGIQFTDMHAETHPSQGNYIALVSGSDYGVHTDKNITLDKRHLGDLLEEKGLDWRVYAEGYPGNCFLGNQGKYVRKHVPFLSFKNIQKNAARCAHIVNAKQFDSDVKAQSLPEFSMYVPDLNNDGHDTSVSYASNWFRLKFSKLFADPTFLDHTLFIITFDEGSWVGSNQIYTVLLSHAISAREISERHSHYSLLRLTENLLGLDSLGQGDETARDINLP